MDLSVRGREVIGMPAGSILLFLAIIEVCREKNFIAVIGPEATCIPRDESSFAELFGGTVEIFNMEGIHSDTHPIIHGHKYGRGGGMAEVHKHNPKRCITWQKAGVCEPGKQSQFLGFTIHPEDILVAL